MWQKEHVALYSFWDEDTFMEYMLQSLLRFLKEFSQNSVKTFDHVLDAHRKIGKKKNHIILQIS